MGGKELLCGVNCPGGVGAAVSKAGSCCDPARKCEREGEGRGREGVQGGTERERGEGVSEEHLLPLLSP